uniref:Receptor kinase-like protein Xa21 n=1 Tax=Leersia perrieri TaxID=77586 RepID=A0A0D9XPJ4_9ORYZ
MFLLPSPIPVAMSAAHGASRGVRRNRSSLSATAPCRSTMLLSLNHPQIDAHRGELSAALSIHVVICSSIGNETDRLSLLEFKNAITLDPRQALMSWNDSTHICSWEGILCRVKAPHRVISLNLSGQGLVGTISPSLGNLTFLRYISLQENISYNNLTGTIPPSLFNITTLSKLAIGFNQIYGEIPREIGNSRVLQVFLAPENKLSGRFQPTILNLSSLTTINLASNHLYGELPSSLGSSMPNLQSGHIPSSLANASKLILIDLSKNNFTGEVPSSIGKLKELSWLNLEFNQLQASDKQGLEFINSLNNCTNLRILSLNENQLEGEIPHSFGNHTVKLQMLFLGGNRLSGRFPAGIANIRSLSGLALESNYFTGPLSDWLGNFRTLQLLSLSQNMFTGFIPSSLSNLSLLEQALLDSNQFYVRIPGGLESLKVLQILNISNNSLHGSIPGEIFSIPTLRDIILSSNILNGTLPIEIGNAKQLQHLVLSSNKLSGVIPVTLGNCESMEEIMLDQNFLSGSIPTSFGNMKSLELLNMSHNLLSGSIPKPIGSLQGLAQLDLSFNNLEGEVPETGIFNNITAIRIAGNTGLCGGAAMLHLPECPSRPPSSTKHMRSIVLKVVIPLACIVSLAMGTTVLLFQKEKQGRKSMSLPSFGRKFPKVSFNDLSVATDGFSTSNLIGRGRYSSVYKGKTLQYGNVVAVKVFSLQTRGAHKSFIAECNALRNVRHRNLVPILTACSSIDSKGNDFKALVYEFMSQGDLHMMLYSTQVGENISNGIHISLAQRLSIVVDVANALEYLHHNNQGTIVHCDLKPSNILLDGSMTAHVGDFGLARFKVDCTISSSSVSTFSNAIDGTIGYVAPEYAAGVEVSTYGDVYSFGIVLFEIFLRKRPTDNMFKDALNIATFVEMNFPNSIPQVVDPELLENQNGLSHEILVDMKKKDLECLYSVLNIGLCCTKPSPYERMDMQEVAARLRLQPGTGDGHQCVHLAIAGGDAGRRCVLAQAGRGVSITVFAKSTRPISRAGITTEGNRVRVSGGDSAETMHNASKVVFIHRPQPPEVMKIVAIGQFLLALMTCSAFPVLCASLFGNETDRLSLLEFKNAISLDPQQSLSSWNDTTHFCSWEGISCNSKNPPRVTAIHLRNQGLLHELTGGFPPDLPIGLEKLDLSANNLVGTIPPTLGNITTLRNIGCTFNGIDGSIPHELAMLRGMKLLADGRNRLSGQFPEAILNMSALVVLGLSFNYFSAYWQISRITMGSNLFQGNLPSSFANASNLIIFDMSENNFTGVVSASIGKLANLKWLNLEMNQLHARSKPDWEFMDSLTNCTQLQEFSVAGNQLEGQLQRLYLGVNQLSGSIPSGIANMPNLIILDLEVFYHNGLGLKTLQILALSNNNLIGYSAKEILLILTIADVEFSFNNLNGELPTEVGNAKQLRNLQLSSNNLSGDIPDALGNCVNLQEVQLDQNNFSGNIPTSFGKLIILTLLNLSQNKLSGSIPVSLGDLELLERLDLSFNHLRGQVPTKGIFKNSTAIQINGNLGLFGGAPELHLSECPTTTSNKRKHKLSVLLKVVIPLAIMVTLAMVLMVFFLWNRRKRTKSISLPSFGREFPKISLRDLARATNGFSTSNLIGTGRYSSVYQGQLFQDINVVAIKVFSLETRGAHKTFISECNALRNVRHRNLVPILTACSSIDSSGNDFKALVYSCHEGTCINYYSQPQRINIVVDVSDALEYLHHNNQGTIIHCDIKPSNILLDDNMIAHVGDFGLARFRTDPSTSLHDSNSISSLAINGTIGYVAPECAEGGQVSTASDVYSFGVVLLEIFIRKRPTDDMFKFKDGLTIAKYAEINFPDRMLHIIDPQLQQELVLCHETPISVKEKGLHFLRSMLNIVLHCTKPTPSELISMQEAAANYAHIVLCASLPGNETDRLSLLEFKKAISVDPQKSLNSWNDSTHFCSWEGVLCRAKSPLRVTSLNLTNRGLAGHISPSIANLTFLKYLSLGKNSFFGEIPTTLGLLHRLQTLILSYNKLQGRIPDLANCSSLKLLWLDRNNLNGKFPNLPPRLQELMLHVNNLSGTIPPSLGNITTLTKFGCAFNNIEGNIPTEFAKLTKLQYLSVNTNNLAGSFQPAILNLSTLVNLDLGTNNLKGEVPFNLGTSLPNLQSLILSANFFDGHIPSSLINASELNLIDMAENNFTGVIPSSIGKIAKLNVLSLQLNQFQASTKKEWEFMDSLANCTKLEVFSLAQNRLQGQVPMSLSNISSQLQYLYLGQNQLSGDFPSGIKKFSNLIILGLDHNQFTGIVPEWLGALQTLQKLSLLDNNFIGFLPTSLSNLSQLSELYLGSNKFDGNIPLSLGGLQMLQVLSISNNSIQGRVPKEIFNLPAITEIDLSFNKLYGQLPIEIGNAKQLVTLELSSNTLFGDIPNTLSNCDSLEDIILDRNAFTGIIPTTLGSIKSLKVLNLSHNNLTGTIPVSLGNLQLLEQLDLSFNHLNGEVPSKGVFKNATSIQIDGNHGLCGGVLELHLHECSTKTPNSTKSKQFVVVKVLIPITIIILLATVAISVLLLRRREHEGKNTSLTSFGRKFPKVSYNELAEATEGFSEYNLIGKGRYGYVYRGKLFQGTNLVAIKVFNLETMGAQKSFIAECNALRNVRHRNLVPILTACSSIDPRGNDFKALVYEFMPMGDLHKLLYTTQVDESTSNLRHITLAQRIGIVADVADALNYLHHNNQGTIVHCDLKPSNILLDDNMTAHVGDFGLARFNVDSTTPSCRETASTSSAAIKGTIGYVAPECAGGGQASTAADVYSFGVVLLEIFIRRRPTDDMFKDGLSIAKFAEMNIPDKMLQIVDGQLVQELGLFKEAPMAGEERRAHCLLSGYFSTL